MVFDILHVSERACWTNCGYCSSIIAALRRHYCLLALDSCRILLQVEICSKDLSRHDGVSCVFKGETAAGITKFKSRTVQKEADCPWGVEEDKRIHAGGTFKGYTCNKMARLRLGTSLHVSRRWVIQLFRIFREKKKDFFFQFIW